METNVKVWLLDMQQAIDEIFQFLGEERNFITYQEDQKTKKAIERNLEIIGEAMSRIMKVNPAIRITNAKKIIGTRNRIIHIYDHISDEVIWTIVCRELPGLQLEIQGLLANEKG